MKSSSERDVGNVDLNQLSEDRAGNTRIIRRCIMGYEKRGVGK